MKMLGAIAVLSFTALGASQVGGAREQPAVRDTSLRKSTAAPQRLIANDVGFPVDVSSDGREVLLLKTDEDPARLLIRNLATNTITDLHAGPLGWRIQRSRPAGVFSPDGKRITYVWYETAQSNEGVTPNLRVMDRNGAASRRLADNGIVPHDWSRDRARVLVLIHGTLKDPTHIAWVSVSNGATTIIKTLEPWRSNTDTGLRLSPDGRMIAYSAGSRQDSTDRQIYVIDANGQNERAVATVKGSNTDPVWTPDSAHVLFINTQGRQRDLYAVSTREGFGSTLPDRLLANFDGELVRISASGDLFYRRIDQGIWQLIAERRPGGARIIEAFPGRNGTWSKGNTLAFVDSGLVIRTNEPRVFGFERIVNSPPRWLRDGNAFISYVTPAGDGGREGGSFYRVDARTGEFTWLVARHTATDARTPVGALSPDDKTLYVAARAKGADSWTRIVAIDLATGAERLVANINGDGLTTGPALALSPDGSTLAIRAETGRLITVRVDGREYRELDGPFPGFVHPGGRLAEGSPFMEWTPDGASIVFAASTPSGGWRIMRVPAGGGQATLFDGLEWSALNSAVPIRRDLDTLVTFDLSPDGTRIAISARASQPAFDLWKIPKVVSVLGKLR